MPISTLSAVSDLASGRSRYWSNVMPVGLDHLNERCNRKSLDWRNDVKSAWCYLSDMKTRADWYLKEWLTTLGKRQSDIARDLDWNKARVSLMLHGKQPYDRDAINEIAAYLNLREYELLMPPEQAMALRRLQSSAEEIVTIAHSAEAEAEERRTGTNG